jgi:hypothetical protein
LLKVVLNTIKQQECNIKFKELLSFLHFAHILY